MSERAAVTSIRLKVPDIEDGQVWVQSTLSATHKLVRRLKDDFSFTDRDLVLISNRGGDLATLELQALKCAQGALYIGSNRRSGLPLREGEQIKVRMRAGEVLTVRDVKALEKNTGVEIRPGQSVVV